MRLLGFSKSQKHILTASKMLCMLLLCSSCTARQSTDMSKDSGSATVTDVTQYIESEGKTGVVLGAGMLQDCFTLRVAETSDTSVKQNVESIESMDEQTISAGDIVLILDENPPDHEGMTRVMIPYGDVPSTYGYIASDQLSTARDDIGKGNQAVVTDCDCYDKPDGIVTEMMSGAVQILSYDNEWCHIEQLGTGAEAVWVRTEQLSFDFNQSVPDIAQ